MKSELSIKASSVNVAYTATVMVCQKHMNCTKEQTKTVHCGFIIKEIIEGVFFRLRNMKLNIFKSLFAFL